MKKIFILLVLFVCFSTVSLFAWEPSDLTKFPSCMTDKNWILNFGFGFDDNIEFMGRSGYTWVPPIRLSFDRNIGLGDQKLPFFFGGIVTYSGLGRKDQHVDWYYSNIGLGFRCGYHFNWGIDNLDTYAVATGGYVIRLSDNEIHTSGSSTLFSVNIGVRYFFNGFFGVWAETGYGTHGVFDIGIAFKF